MTDRYVRHYENEAQLQRSIRIVLKYALIAVFPALVWMLLTAQVNLEGLLLGYVLSLGVVATLLRGREPHFEPRRLPAQAAAVVIYTLVLSRDIFLSGIDVVQRIIGIKPVNPGIIRVAVQDKDKLIAGLSAHSITITPGELVVEFDDDAPYLYVHVLDTGSSSLEKLNRDQSRRLAIFKRILGR